MDTRCIIQASLILAGLFVWSLGVQADESSMVEKNLFAPERKPVESQAAEPKPEAPKMAKGSIQLDGVIIRGETRKAILKVNPGLLKDQKNKTNPFVTLGLNEQIGEYRIEKIEPRGITRVSWDNLEILCLFGKTACRSICRANARQRDHHVPRRITRAGGSGQIRKNSAQVQPPAKRRRPRSAPPNQPQNTPTTGQAQPTPIRESQRPPPFCPRRWIKLTWRMARIQPRKRMTSACLSSAC
jgi:hypothetical protein